MQIHVYVCTRKYLCINSAYIYHGHIQNMFYSQYYPCVCVCVLPSILQGSSVRPSRRLGYFSPAPEAIPKDLVTIHLRGSTWGDLFWPPLVPS